MMKRKKKGFTLVEIIITLALIVVFTVIAVFTLRSRMSHQRLRKSLNFFYSDLQLARSKAIANNTIHYINFIDNRTYTIKIDSDNDGNIGTGAQGVASSIKKLPTEIKISNTLGTGIPNSSDFLFYPDGSLILGVGLASQCQIIVQNINNKECYGITLKKTGLMKIEKKTGLEVYTCTCPL